MVSWSHGDHFGKFENRKYIEAVWTVEDTAHNFYKKHRGRWVGNGSTIGSVVVCWLISNGN